MDACGCQSMQVSPARASASRRGSACRDCAPAELAGIIDRLKEAAGAVLPDALVDVAAWPFEQLADAVHDMTGIDLDTVADRAVLAVVAATKQTVQEPQFWASGAAAFGACGSAFPAGCIAIEAWAAGQAIRIAQHAREGYVAEVAAEIRRRTERNSVDLTAQARGIASDTADRAVGEVRSRVDAKIDQLTEAGKRELWKQLAADPRMMARFKEDLVRGMVAGAEQDGAVAIRAAVRLGMSREVINREIYKAVSELVNPALARAVHTGVWTPPAATSRVWRGVREWAEAEAAKLLPQWQPWANGWQTLALISGGPWNVTPQAAAAVEAIGEGLYANAPIVEAVGRGAEFKSNLRNTIRAMALALAGTAMHAESRARIAARFKTDNAGAAQRIAGGYVVAGIQMRSKTDLPSSWVERGRWAAVEARREAGDPAYQTINAARSAPRPTAQEAQRSFQTAAAAAGFQLDSVQSAHVQAVRATQKRNRLAAWAAGAATAFVGLAVIIKRARK